ncbi:MAG TPA: hypothetical protein VIP56_14055, partial [Nitrososphaeraceae archaeon]
FPAGPLIWRHISGTGDNSFTRFDAGGFYFYTVEHSELHRYSISDTGSIEEKLLISLANENCCGCGLLKCDIIAVSRSQSGHIIVANRSYISCQV